MRPYLCEGNLWSSPPTFPHCSIQALSRYTAVHTSQQSPYWKYMKAHTCAPMLDNALNASLCAPFNPQSHLLGRHCRHDPFHRQGSEACRIQAGLKCLQCLAPHLRSDFCMQCCSKRGGEHCVPSVVALSSVSLQGQYRATLYEYWVNQLTVYRVPHTSKPTLITTLGNPVKIRSWQVTIRCQNVLQTGPRASCLLSTLLSVDTSSGSSWV